MLSWFRDLDGLLRGQRTSSQLLKEGRIDLPLRTFFPLAILLGATYGFFMGWYAISERGWDGVMQLVASAVKLPALFLLTLMVTFPSLYVFSALAGCRLSFISTLRLLVSAVVVNVAVAASLGPILGFFTLSTTSYPFMILLNVLLLGIAGLVALAFVLHSLRRLAPKSAWQEVYRGMPRPPIPPKPAAGPRTTLAESLTSGADDPEKGAPAPPLPSGQEPGLLDSNLDADAESSVGQARLIFQVWVVTYSLVGAQMGWLLRPFIGSPDMKFTWFRLRESNVFHSIVEQLHNVLGG